MAKLSWLRLMADCRATVVGLYFRLHVQCQELHGGPQTKWQNNQVLRDGT